MHNPIQESHSHQERACPGTPGLGTVDPASNDSGAVNAEPTAEETAGPEFATARTAITRRTVLAGLVAAGATSLAGCQSGNDAYGNHTPVDVAADQCDVCGMVIGEQFGPSGQVYYADESPESHPNPARFDALAPCLFPYHFRKEQRGWTASATFVTDYSSVDFDLTEHKGTTYISGHSGPETYARADEVTLVVDSRVEGAMGREAISFSNREDAVAFSDEWDGRLLAFDDVEPGTFARG